MVGVEFSPQFSGMKLDWICPICGSDDGMKTAQLIAANKNANAEIVVVNLWKICNGNPLIQIAKR
jgi:hypothetical protein